MLNKDFEEAAAGTCFNLSDLQAGVHATCPFQRDEYVAACHGPPHFAGCLSTDIVPPMWAEAEPAAVQKLELSQMLLLLHRMSTGTSQAQ